MATLAMFLCRRGESLVDLNFDHIHLREDHWAVLTTGDRDCVRGEFRFFSLRDDALARDGYLFLSGGSFTRPSKSRAW